MIVFLRNIPRDTTHGEIVSFVSPVIKGGFLKPKGEIKKISILSILDKNTKLTEYHALVYIDPDKAALRAIKKLHGDYFRDKRIAVRQYFVRSHIDTRLISYGEKRRDLEITEIAAPKFVGDKIFHRRY